MGDSRGKVNDPSRGTNQSVDSQFLQDLERATRLSLESFKTEQDNRNNTKRLFSPPLSAGSRVSPNVKEVNGRDKDRPLEITPRPRPLARPISAVITSPTQSGSNGNRNSNGIVLSPPPTTDSPVIPPPSPFKRHRSLPYRRHLTHPPILDPLGGGGGHKETPPKNAAPPSSDDLISLASPLVTPKFNLNARTSLHCDSPYALPVDDISPKSPVSPMTTPFFPPPAGGPPVGVPLPGMAMSTKGGHIPFGGGLAATTPSQPPMLYPMLSQPMSQGLMSRPAALNLPRPPYPPLPPTSIGMNHTHGLGTTSAVIGGILHNLAKSKLPGGGGSNGIGPITPLRQTSPPTVVPNPAPISLYKRVSEELMEMNADDLIDFGSRSALNDIEEVGSHTILEYFDPLVIRETERKMAEQTSKQQRQDIVNKSKGQEGQPQGQKVTNTTGSDRVEELYNASCASTATSAFTYRSNSGSMSLYPSLLDFEHENLYGTLSGTLRRRMHEDTTSSLYDVYNPFEYSYTVSCSSPAAAVTAAAYAEIAQKGRVNGENGKALIGFCIAENSGPFSNSASSSGVPTKIDPRRDSIISTSSSISSASRVQIRSRSLSHDKSKRGGKLYENIESIMNIGVTDSEIQALGEIIRELRQSCRYVDTRTNKGYIRSAVMENNSIPQGYSVKIVVWPEIFNGDPVTFTSDISSHADLVLEQSIIELVIDGSARDYLLRVKGLNEYLEGDIPLAKYVYVQQCIKMDEDVQFIVVKRSSMLKESYARTQLDDTRAEQFNFDDLLPQVQGDPITYDKIGLLLKFIDDESERIRKKVNSYMFGGFVRQSTDTNPPGILSAAVLIQPVKAVCVLLYKVVTIEIVNCLNFFANACDEWNSKVKEMSATGEIPLGRNSLDPSDADSRRTKIIGDVGNDYSIVEVVPSARDSSDKPNKELVFTAMDRLIASVSCLVDMYSKTFPVSFRMKDIPKTVRPESQDVIPMGERSDPLMIRIGAIHRLKPEWLTTYVDFFLVAEVLHGACWMGNSATTFSAVRRADGHFFFNTILFDNWLRFDHVPICMIPREARVVFTLFARKPSDDNHNPMEIVELGWASIQCISFKGLLVQGDYLLPFWEVGLAQQRTGPAPNASTDGKSPLISVEFLDFGQDMHFPEIPTRMEFRRDFATLDTNTQVLLKDIIATGVLTKIPPEEAEILWEKRFYLQDFPEALPKVLSAAQLWDWTGVADTYALLENWKEPGPFSALQLLLPQYADIRVRKQAVTWISKLADEDLINLLPQLVEALSYETFDVSPLSKFLLKKSLSSVSFSHGLFWMLASQIGIGKWGSEQRHCDPVISRVSRTEDEMKLNPKHRRLELILNSLMIICGEKWRSTLISEYKMVENLNDIANQVKAATKDSTRMSILNSELQRLSANVFNGSTSMPLPCASSVHVQSIHPNPKMSSYFNSNATPLKVSFLSGLPEGGCVPTIFKTGDDLRQDMLTLQTIRLIDKWWLGEGLDLKVLTFMCVPTGPKQGMVEMVANAETLCKIQAEYGVTGVFRDSAISDWLAKMNPSTLDYRRAVENFTLSCAAYCVITYILGICDRHNDNIMLTKKGHLFHIDFGKFLGDAQMFINFKRDRTPFVLTSDMIYVINDGEKGGHRFHRFVELCCRAFQIVRSNGNELLTLFHLMESAGIPCVDHRSVVYIRDALLPDCSNVEAAAKFTRFIEESSQNWFTPVNFFLHSLAQIRFSSETPDNPKTLSFIPTVYTMEEEGRIEKALVVSCQKKYDPEKYYSYTIKLKRKGHADWSFLHRSYKEFLELRSKLCINFPKADGALTALARRGGIGRSNVKEVAEKRRDQLNAFLQSLFGLADEIGHSNLVYTFFHPILRDEVQHLDEESRKSVARASLMRDPSRIYGQIKLSLQYGRGALQILILHAVDLVCPNGQQPSTYVKTYLRPDNSRLTKRKTRVLRRNEHPSFMEVISYRLPMDIIRQRTLEISVWHHDSFQENSFLGGVAIPLANATFDRETIETHTLGNLQ